MPSSNLPEALTSLLQRSGGFVVATDAGGRFVQFAGGVGEPLLLDVPNLDAAEGAKIVTAFAGQPFSLNGNMFNLPCADPAAGAAAAQTVFTQVFGVAAPQLSLLEE